ncbi:hypothetical protein [Actinocrispum wychmicini]|uniref:Uncharacterized protein n=1 Tax=Actinocrispum wychmicini TaxID=1213861 RepID=A0A4R2IMW3_9PSEU|nr:hypothetical protein [Actinocrispum wychmicini]TCO45328.1 hypothetical protein EV192_12192 [Actinocrispum wychmicini]
MISDAVMSLVDLELAADSDLDIVEFDRSGNTERGRSGACTVTINLVVAS